VLSGESSERNGGQGDSSSKSFDGFHVRHSCQSELGRKGGAFRWEDYCAVTGGMKSESVDGFVQIF
jgi:hypothetical protein